MKAPGAVRKAAQRARWPQPMTWHDDPKPEPSAKPWRHSCCRFCCGIPHRRDPLGCPLGPVGCGLPFADERKPWETP
jgi:hypothetical protein